MNAPRFGWYGDDFTGATDTLAVMTQAGYRAMLFLDVPSPAQQAAAATALGGTIDALGIAGATRAMAPDAMRQTLEPVGAFYESLGTPVVHYKVCSTFDSAPTVGSIGEAIRVLRPFVRNRFVPIVGGQPNIGRYCAFSNLFAAAGAGGTVHRLDRHPTMRQHPVTPMHEADLRAHLSQQGLGPIAALHYPSYARTPEAQADALADLLDGGADAVLMDVAEPAHLAAVGRLVWHEARRAPLLAVGSSVVAQALIAHWQADGDPAVTQRGQTALGTVSGAVFVFAGSLSPVTARQIAAAVSYRKLALDAGRLLGDATYAAAMQDEISHCLLGGQHLLAYTTAANADTSLSNALTSASSSFVAQVVFGQAALGRPLRRLGIAGGDTSSHAVKALGLWGLSFRGVLGPGVTVSCAHSENPALDGVEIMLKGGQMGADDVFERLLSG